MIQKFSLLTAIKGFNKYLFEEMKETPLHALSLDIEIPYYVVQGKYDYTSRTSIAKQYFEQIKA